MDQDILWGKLAQEAEKILTVEKVDFSKDSTFSKASQDVWKELAKYRIGPAVLTLLLSSAFPEEKREKIYQEIKRVILENR